MVFALAFLIAIYAYLIFFLGLLGLLQQGIIVGLTTSFGVIFLVWFVGKFGRLGRLGKEVREKRKRLSLVLLGLIFLQILVNLIGALGPELSFDALWYHLSLPKIYLSDHRLHFVPGGLLYYSASPQLMEMLYTAALSLGGVVLAKLVHFLFGIGCLFVLYKILRKFLSADLSLLGCLIFYSQLTVGWLSTTAYTDLAVVFFQTGGFLAFIYWWQEKKTIWLWEAGLLFGLSSAVKLTGLYVPLSIIFIFLLRILLAKTRRILFRQILVFCLAVLVPLLPWFSFAYFNTGSPFYPYLTSWFFKTQSNGLRLTEWLVTRHPLNLVKVLWQTTFTRGDILTPVILIGLPVILYPFFKKLYNFFRRDINLTLCHCEDQVQPETKQSLIFKIATPRHGGARNDKRVKFLLLYLVLNFLSWFLIPLNYNRFLLPLVPIFTLVLLIELDKFWRKTLVWKTFIFAVFLIAFLNLSVRAIANSKFIPLILGKETEAEFIKKYLNFEAGNFYDVDSFFAKRIGKNEKVLVEGIHNLFYLDFPFAHISWAKKGDTFDYLLVGRDVSKERFQRLPLVYTNEKTGVSLYKVKTSF